MRKTFEKTEVKIPQVFKKFHILSGDIRQRVNAPTAIFHSVGAIFDNPEAMDSDANVATLRCGGWRPRSTRAGARPGERHVPGPS